MLKVMKNNILEIIFVKNNTHQQHKILSYIEPLDKQRKTRRYIKI